MLLSEWISEERGRGVALARFLNVPASMVTRMAAGKKPIPLRQCPYIQQFTGNRVTCEEMRPDEVEYFELVRAQAREPAGATGAAFAHGGLGNELASTG